MIDDHTKNIQLQERPHVVILGAGASRAATPESEKNGRTLPLMKELPEAIELNSIVDRNDFLAAKNNFEAYFNELFRKGKSELQKEIEVRLYSYFDSIKIVDQVTPYDRLVLSLRRKDVIATFNWDPLLPYAYRRNGYLKNLPPLLFLHGNVRLGICEKHSMLGWNDGHCIHCGSALAPSKLLFPVSDKDYTSDPVISEAWSHLDWYLGNAYFLTIFGYSAPITDVEARERIVARIGSNSMKNLMQLEIVDVAAEDLLNGNLRGVVDGTHFGGSTTIDHSWLTRHPRLTCEALWEATMMQNPIKPIELPKTNILNELQQWVAEFDACFPKFNDEGPEWMG